MLPKLKETMSKETFGIPMSQAIAQGICIQCRQEALPRCYSDPGRREYYISGLCELCFDSITNNEE